MGNPVWSSLVSLDHTSDIQVDKRLDSNVGADRICKQLGYKNGVRGPRKTNRGGSGPIHILSSIHPRRRASVLKRCKHTKEYQSVICSGGLGPQTVKESISWNCTENRVKEKVKVMGDNLTIISPIRPLERCYWVFTHEDKNYQCCYGVEDWNENGKLERKWDCDRFKSIFNSDSDPRCLKRGKYLVKNDYLGLTSTCNLTISLSSASDGNYQSLDVYGEAIQRCSIAAKREFPETSDGTAGAIVVVLLLVSC